MLDSLRDKREIPIDWDVLHSEMYSLFSSVCDRPVPTCPGVNIN